jgi:hypothetical protein
MIAGLGCHDKLSWRHHGEDADWPHAAISSNSISDHRAENIFCDFGIGHHVFRRG